MTAIDAANLDAAILHEFDTPAIRQRVQELTREVLLQMTARRSGRPQPAEPTREQRIIAAVCGHFEITRAQLFGSGRHAAVARPRMVAAWLLRHAWGGMSLPRIGRLLGGRDHTTALYGIQVVDRTPALLAMARELLGSLQA